MSKEQKQDIENLFKSYSANYKTLDYVCGWLLKGSEYCKQHYASLAFVATNSVVQGSHVPNLWPVLFKNDVCISFAYKSFKWKNNATNNAGVTCVIIGLSHDTTGPKYLFDSSGVKECKNINGYLLDAPNVIIKKASKPISKQLPEMEYGNKPVDGGHLILNEQEKNCLTNKNEKAETLIKKFIGSNELIKGLKRYCLWIPESRLELAKSIPEISCRIDACKEVRLNSKDAGARKLATVPYQFREFRIAKEAVIVVPSVSSENREYLPIDVRANDTVISNLAFGIYDSGLWVFSVLCSRMHLIWIKAVCGQLETRIRYSNTLGWNTFPLPKLNDQQIEELEKAAREILLIRERHYPKPIAELYDKSLMPKDLREAHEYSDSLIEDLYRDTDFESDEQRLEHLFKCYDQMTKGGEK
jgi:hypothetical protein